MPLNSKAGNRMTVPTTHAHTTEWGEHNCHPASLLCLRLLKDRGCSRDHWNTDLLKGEWSSCAPRLSFSGALSVCEDCSALTRERHVVAGRLGEKSGLAPSFLTKNRINSHEITQVRATFVMAYERIIPTIFHFFLSCGECILSLQL